MLLCEMCGEQFDYRTNLNRHQLQHKPLPKFNCGECTKRYRHLRNLVRHIQAHHTGRILTCDKCHKSFTYKNSLVRHLDTIHRVIHWDWDTHTSYSKVNKVEKGRQGKGVVATLPLALFHSPPREQPINVNWAMGSSAGRQILSSPFPSSSFIRFYGHGKTQLTSPLIEH